MSVPQAPRRDPPWVFRTYSGHSSARASNELYRQNLARGQTGLSVAFDLPTQTGVDSDHPLARGEVGKVGVPIGHLDDLQALFAGIPIDRMNTSMTINATAAWLLALYVALAERTGADPHALEGTTQNDIIKEYLSRGTYIFPPGPSLRLISDMIAYSVHAIPRWNPINVCSYHLQEAGATPEQEIAYALANALAVLDAVRDRDDVPEDAIPRVVGRISFFVNAGIRFVEETCKVRAMTLLWDELTRERYGVEDAKLRRFRYGVQVNSLGLTEAQPENNLIRIVLEALGVTLSKDARARALQLPAWNEALGLPRPWDQQWSLRVQQILAYETDLLEYDDLFEGSRVIDAKTRELAAGAREELARVLAMGGAVAAVENAYMKRQLVASHTRRIRAIESGELTVVGVNAWTDSEPSPLTAGPQSVLVVDESAERAQIEALRAFRSRRNAAEVRAALTNLDDALAAGANVMPPSIRAAHAGVTTGEWADALRRRFGEYRAPTGIVARGETRGESAAQLRERVRLLSSQLGRPIKLLVGKPGLDGHSNGAEQIAVAARDAGMEVVYEGIRLTPAQIAHSARDEGVHIVGLSILSGSHGILVVDVLDELREVGCAEVPVIVGGIIPEDDARKLRSAGVRRVYTPKDFDLTRIMGEIVDVVAEARAAV
jgi:(2R)-ethylmalonyl-CoA mutase